MNEIILLKLGEVVLKGLNRRTFENKLMANIRRRLQHCGTFHIYSKQSTIYVEPQNENCNMEGAYAGCLQIFGIIAVARCLPCEKSKEAILETVKTYLNDELLAAKTFKVSGETIKLNSKQYTQFAKTKGQTAFDILEAAVDSSTYKKMTDAEKAEFVKDVYEYANAKAKAEVSKYQLDGKNAKIAQAEAKGIKPVQFLTITGAYDKDGNGSVTQEEAKEVLDKSGLTKAQKAYLWKLQNKSWKNNPYN